MRLEDWYALTERDEERKLRRKLNSFGHKALCVAMGALEAFVLLFAFAALVAFLAALCA